MVKITKYSTPTCAHCKLLQPMLDGKANEGKIDMVEKDATQHPEDTEKYGFMSVPTVVFHAEDGDIVKTGVRDIQQQFGILGI